MDFREEETSKEKPFWPMFSLFFFCSYASSSAPPSLPTTKCTGVSDWSYFKIKVVVSLRVGSSS